jgi:ferredoxin
MRITVDRDLCVGAGQCVLSAPETFELSEMDGLVVLRSAPSGHDVPGNLREAVRQCPSGALSLAEATGDR